MLSACTNATGQYIPPIIMFKGKRKRDDFLLDMPPGTEVVMTEKGWITVEAFNVEKRTKFVRARGGVVSVIAQFVNKIAIGSQ